MEKIKGLIKKFCTKEVIFAVLVAYITNKDWVFHSEAKGFKEKFIEFWKFIAGRAFTMVLEFGLDALLFLIPAVSASSTLQMVVKMFITVIVVVLNFFISKFFSFKKVSK